jgi:hypothetical protein
MTKPEIHEISADRLPGKAVAVLFFEDQRPLQGPAALLDWRLDGQVTRMMIDGGLTGRAGEHLMLQNNGKLSADWALLIGGGKWQGLCRDTYAALIAHTLQAALQAGFKDLSLCLAPHEDADSEELVVMTEQALAQHGGGLTSCRLSRVALFDKDHD